MIDKNTGHSLQTEQQSIQQSLQDIITTPIGSRVMRREYGSLIFELLDQPINDAFGIEMLQRNLYRHFSLGRPYQY